MASSKHLPPSFGGTYRFGPDNSIFEKNCKYYYFLRFVKANSKKSQKLCKKLSSPKRELPKQLFFYKVPSFWSKLCLKSIDSEDSTPPKLKKTLF